MPRDLFGTDGVRGIAGTYPLDSEGVRHIAMAVGSQFAASGSQIVIGQDTRESSNEIVAELSAGLNSVGVAVVRAGVIPTPGLAFITKDGNGKRFSAGIMVTASHNPYEYNGIKVFDGNGDKLTDETEAILNTLINDEILPKTPEKSYTDHDLRTDYEDFLISSAPGLDLHGLSMAVDSANGSASGLAERILTRLGAQVTALFDKPNGRNINDGCGATDTTILAKRVISDSLSLGIAFDGDADRLIMIDGKGREIKGDILLYILAVTDNHKGVVATVMSNQGLETALKRHDIKLVRTDVGDRYVLEGLERSGYNLGGEQSGHIIMPRLLATGDGLLAAVQILNALGTSKKTLEQWYEEVKMLPQALVNIPLADKKILESPEIQTFLNEQTNQLAGQGRLLIRPSGTEPLARVMVEADNAQQRAEHVATRLQELIERQPAVREEV